MHVAGDQFGPIFDIGLNTTEYWRAPSSFTTLESGSLRAFDGTSRQVIPVCSNTRAGMSIT